MAKFRLMAWILVAVALVAVAGLYMRGQNSSENPAGVMEEKIALGGPFKLTNHKGEPFESAALQGQYQLIYFGYTYCPDVCPLELAKMTTALRGLESEGLDTSSVQPLFISVDPERDTPEALGEYVVLFHDRLVGLTGTLENIRSVAKSFRIYFGKREDQASNDYLMDHTSLIFLMGPDGEFLQFFSSADGPDRLKEVMRPLLEKAL